MRSEWFHHVKRLFQMVRFLIKLFLFVKFNLYFTFKKKYNIQFSIITKSKKKQSKFFNFVAYVMQAQYKEFIQQTIREYTEFMSEHKVTFYIK